MNIFFSNIFNKLNFRSPVNLLVLVSFALHLVVFHPTDINLVICKSDGTVNVEKVYQNGKCEHERTAVRQATLNIENNCEDTPLFAHQHDYESAKVRSNSVVLPEMAILNCTAIAIQNNVIVKTVFSSIVPDMTVKIVATQSMLI